jgi:hypothetical protein
MDLKEKKNEASGSHMGPIGSDTENISANHEPGLEKIRLRAYEIHLERGGLPGNELDDWLKAERELHRAAPQTAQEFLTAGGTE